MRKNTEQIESLLAGYVEGDLDPRQRAEVDRYLADNPSQQRLVQRMVAVRGLLRALPREPAPSELREDVQAQLERGLLLGDPIDDEVSAVEMRIDRWSQLRAAAAIALLVAGVAAAIYWALPDEQQRPELAIAPVDVPRLEESEDRARRDNEVLPGVVALSRIDELRTPVARGAPTDGAEPAAPGGGGATPPGNADRESRASSTPADAGILAWLPVRLDDPSSPDFPGMEASRNDPLLASASVLAASNAADMLVMVRTDDPAAAHVAAETYFLANGIAAAPLPAGEESRFSRAVQRAVVPAAEAEVPPPAGRPLEPASSGATTHPASEPAPAAPADAGEAPLDDRFVQARRALSEHQVVLARALTVQQAAELGKSLAAESKRQGKLQRPADVRLYARTTSQVVEQLGRQVPQQAQLPAAWGADLAGQDRRERDRDRVQAPEEEVPGELAPGDVLIVAMPTPDGGSRESRVRIGDDGAIELPPLGRVPAAGLTTTQLGELILARLAEQPPAFAQKSGPVVSVRRVPAPVVPRLGWNTAPRAREAAAGDRLDLLLIIRSETPMAPATAPSTAPADAR